MSTDMEYTRLRCEREKGVIIASLFVTICEITEIPTWHMALASKAIAYTSQLMLGIAQHM